MSKVSGTFASIFPVPYCRGGESVNVTGLLSLDDTCLIGDSLCSSDIAVLAVDVERDIGFLQPRKILHRQIAAIPFAVDRSIMIHP